jgi:hypothetical protein
MITSRTSEEHKAVYYDCIFLREQRQDSAGVKNWSLLNKIWGYNSCLIDRTNTITMPVNCATLPWLLIPEYQPVTDDFGQICQQRAEEIWLTARQRNLTVAVLWSGGIDSTLALTSLLSVANKEDRERLIILLNRDSIIEYDWFYHTFIKNKIRCTSSDLWHNWVRNDTILVTGEGGDQIVFSGFDSSRTKIIKDMTLGNDKDSVLRALSYMTDDTQAAKVCFENVIEPLMEISPIDLGNKLSPFWWTWFCIYWQPRYFTLLKTILKGKISTITDSYLEMNWLMFFNSDSMQRWAMENQTKFLSSGNEKMIFKKIIYDFTNDEIYLQNKQKFSSLQNIKRSSRSRALVTRDWQFLDSTDERYLLKENSFT